MERLRKRSIARNNPALSGGGDEEEGGEVGNVESDGSKPLGRRVTSDGFLGND